MAGLFSRLKNWANGETVTNEDLNAEFDNILSNLDADQIDDYSGTVTEMRVTTDPGEVGSESLATSTAGEIERLRFMIKDITGGAQWYSSPSNTLASLGDAVGGGIPNNRIVSGLVRSGSSQLVALDPAGSGNGLTVTLRGSSTNFVYAIDGTLYTISTDVASSAITAAPSTNNTCLVNEAFADDSEETKYLGEFGSSLTVDNMGSEISTLVGEIAGFKIDNGVSTEYFIARVKSTTELDEIRRGYFFDTSQAPIPRLAIANNDTITLMRLSYIFANTSGALVVVNSNVLVQSDTPSSPSLGQYWFDITNDTWKLYNGSSFEAANATLIGVAISDDTDTLGARTFDQFKSIDDKNTIELEIFDNTQVRGTSFNQEVNVFGTEVKFGEDIIKFDMDSDLDSGITEAARTVYYLYVDETGDGIISDLAPANRYPAYQSLYHPYQTWRCVGVMYNDSSSNITEVISFSDRRESNIGIVSEVNSSALTVRVLRDPSLKYHFGNDTAQGKASILPGTALTISSGSTLGTEDATDAELQIAGMLNSGRMELAIGFRGDISPGDLITTVAEGGAGGADTYGTLYSKVALTTKAAMPLGKAVSNQTTAGTWAATLDELKLWPFLRSPGLKKRAFTASGSLVVPKGVTAVRVHVIGGGGGAGGGGNNAGTGAPGGGGGGGGGTLMLYSDLPVSGGETLTVTVGAAGSGGAGSTVGTSGGTSSVTNGTWTVEALGGGYGGGGGNGGGGTTNGDAGGSSYAAGGSGGGNVSGRGGGGGGGGGYTAGANGGAGINSTQVAVSTPAISTANLVHIIPGGGGGGGQGSTASGANNGGDGGDAGYTTTGFYDYPAGVGGSGGASSGNTSGSGGGGAGSPFGDGGDGANGKSGTGGDGDAGSTPSTTSYGAGGGGGGGTGINGTNTGGTGGSGIAGKVTIYWIE